MASTEVYSGTATGAGSWVEVPAGRSVISASDFDSDAASFTFHMRKKTTDDSGEPHPLKANGLAITMVEDSEQMLVNVPANHEVRVTRTGGTASLKVWFSLVPS